MDGIQIDRGDLLFDDLYPPLEHIVQGMIVRDTLWMLSGRPKGGKSWLLLGLARALDSGAPWLGRETTRPSRVLYFALEDGRRRIWERIHAMGWRPQHVDFAFALPQKLGQGGEFAFSVSKERHGYEVFIVDTLRAALGGGDENDNNFMGSIMTMLADLAHRDQFTLILSHHTRKGGGADGDAFDAIRGASATRGSYDGGAVLVRARGEKIARLELESRDLDVDDLMIEWRGTREGWQALGTREEYQAQRESELAGKIIAAAKAQGGIDIESAAELIQSDLKCEDTTAKKKAYQILGGLAARGMMRVETTRGDGAGRPRKVYKA